MFSAANGASQNMVIRRLSKYETLDYDIKWTNVNATGVFATVQIKEGNDINGVNNKVPFLNYEMQTTDGSVALQHQDFGTESSKIEVAFGNATTGVVEVLLIAKRR